MLAVMDADATNTMIGELVVASGMANNRRRLLARVFDVLHRRLIATRAELLVLDERTGVARGHVATTAGAEVVPTELELGKGLVMDCLKSRCPCVHNFDDGCSEDEIFLRDRMTLGGSAQAEAVLVAPLLDAEGGRAVMLVYFLDAGEVVSFSKELLSIVRAVVEIRHQSLSVLERLAALSRAQLRALRRAQAEVGAVDLAPERSVGIHDVMQTIERVAPRVDELRQSLERAIWLSCGPETGLRSSRSPRSHTIPSRTAETLAEAQRRCIGEALAATEGKIYGAHGAAQRLGLKPSTLQSKMKRLGIDRGQFVSGGASLALSGEPGPALRRTGDAS